MEITIKRYSRKMTYEDAATLDEFWELAKRRERSLRACLKSPRTRLGGVFSVQTSLKTLAIRQDCGGFLPCWTKNPLANPRTLRS